MPSDPVLEDATVLPVLEERLDVTRRVVETGAVRVRKLVHKDVVDVRRHHVTEHVDTERIPVGRVVQGPQPVRHEGDTMIVPVVEERTVVRKELVLVEEIRITRRREIREVPEEITLKRESVVVERLDPATQQWHPTQDIPESAAKSPAGPAEPSSS